MSEPMALPGVTVNYGGEHAPDQPDVMGMRPMQARVWLHRGEQYLLIKSPPASGKSRALMFVALDKLANQKVDDRKLRQAIIAVPERSIGASFHDEPLSQHGFFADWRVEPQWNLCDAPGGDNGGKVAAVRRFLDGPDQVLVCTHATLRFAFERFSAAAFDDRLIAVDEFHHVSASEDNRLGDYVHQLMERDKVHIVAMTGSYFRGDAVAVLHPDDEAKFTPVTYTYYEQMRGYQYLKQLEMRYCFYTNRYTDAIAMVLDPTQKTIVHIPNVNARESLKEKVREADHVIGTLGEWLGTDPTTGFQRVRTADGRVLRVADLVDDDPAKRERVAAALRDPAQKGNRDHVDVIVALGMAKEGFDWIWCEHALTVGYRSSLTEVVQIIGRTTRDAPGKTRARFTNLLAEPDATEQAVAEAVNDTLKAIAASLLMEQVLLPRVEFRPKYPNSVADPDLDYGPGGYDPTRTNVGLDPATGTVHLEVNGLAEPKSPEATRIVRQDLNDLVTAFVQNVPLVQQGMFNTDAAPEEITQVRMGRIVREKYPNLSEDDQEAVRQHAVAALAVVQQAMRMPTTDPTTGEPSPNTAFVDGVRRFVSVRELDIDLIDRVNPFEAAYEILAKALGTERLKVVAEVIAARKVAMTLDEAIALGQRAKAFKKERGRLPQLTATDPWEKRMAEGIAFLQQQRKGIR